jgi:hypothetical protein
MRGWTDPTCCLGNPWVCDCCNRRSGGTGKRDDMKSKRQAGNPGSKAKIFVVYVTIRYIIGIQGFTGEATKERF